MSENLNPIVLEVEEVRVVNAVSPTVDLGRTETGALVTVHDYRGTQTVEILDGPVGPVGPQGPQGESGAETAKAIVEEAISRMEDSIHDAQTIGQTVAGYRDAAAASAAQAQEVLESKPSTETTDAEGVDLDIADFDGNVIARFKDGHIQTKNFNSAEIDVAALADIAVTSERESDLDIVDQAGYVVARFKDGHIQTKNFNSAAGVSNVENPYHDVLFGNDIIVPTTTHDHCTAQSAIDAMLGKGLTALAISNYHPSTPFYPVSDHGLSVGAGVTEIPNAEHVDFTNAQCHLNSIGSMFSSGSAPGETPGGVNDTWQRGIIMMKRQFLSPELGSITVNHPTWTGLPLRTILDILDFDESVVGLEIYNQDADVNFSKGWALDTWDNILKTGRRCFGFAVPDHYAESSDKQNWKGRINLFVPENTQENCMSAIRHGRFFIQLYHTSLALTGLEVSGRRVTVSVSTSATIKTIINGAVFDTSVGTSKTVTVPDDAVYVRFEAATANDTIYTNPVMFMTRK